MRNTRSWLQFAIGRERYALPVEAVAQVVAIENMRPTSSAGWAGLLPLEKGILPLADGACLVEDQRAEPAHGPALVLRGRLPLGFTTDSILGLTTGIACPLVGRIGIPSLAQAALPAANGTTLILDGEGVWQRLRSAIEQQADGTSYRLLPLHDARPVDNATQPGSEPAASDQRQPDAVIHPDTAQPDHEGIAEASQEPGLQASEIEGPDPAQLNDTQPANTPACTSTQSEPFSGRVLVFRAGPEADLGVPLDCVIEVGPPRSARPLPSGPRQFAGLLEWRGRLVPLVDLPARLGRGSSEAHQIVYLALTGHASQALAVRFGEMAGSATVPTVHPPAVAANEAGGEFAGVPRAWMHGVARLGRRPLVVLDPAALVRP